MDNLQGRVAVITGGASGIGLGTALALARAGVRLVIADIDEVGVQAAAEKVGGMGSEALGVPCDVAAATASDTLKAATLDRFGRVDIVMNNVGVLTRGRPEDLPIEEWQRIFDINLMSVVRSNHVFLPLLLAQGDGHIVNTASFAGLFTYSYDRLPYAASKAAIIQISEGLAIYLRPKGIGVTCLCPGPVMTNIMRSVKSFSTGLDMRGPGPMFRPLEPAIVGDMVVDAIRNNRFMLPTHDEVGQLLVKRAENWDVFLQTQIDSPFVIVPASPKP